jgi:hypothetical protein
MFSNVKYIAILTILISLISCKSEVKEIHTYFGGKIIHPKSDHVILYSMDQAIDTFFLDEQNKFFGELKIASEGLFYFTHGLENQYVYLRPSDSLLLRLNTWDFDESLVFAGKGADRNNVLLDCFLEEEKEANDTYELNKLVPTKFKEKFDSLIKDKFFLFDEYVKNHPDESEGYRKVLKVALTYPLYARFEKYPMIHAKLNDSEQLPEINKSFYNYRKFAKIDDDSLIYYPPYSKYVRNHLYNETYSLGHTPMKKNYTPKFTSDLLTIINKKITQESTKNAFLKQTIISHFFNKSSCSFNEEPFEKFLKFSSNEEDKTQVKNLINDTKSIELNNELVEFNINDYLDSPRSIHSLIDGKNAFLFFWSPEYVSETYLVSRINFLVNTYQNITFIPIKIDGIKTERIEKLDIKSQYYLADDSKANTFLTSKMPRSILINKKGKVINGYASISSPNLDEYLENLNKLK